MANKNVVIILLLSIIVARPAIALDMQEYEKLKATSRDVLRAHIDGIGEGYSWSNSILKDRGDPPLYCPPSESALYADDYMAIIDEYYTVKLKKPGAPDVPVELILYFGLVDTFPCTK